MDAPTAERWLVLQLYDALKERLEALNADLLDRLGVDRSSQAVLLAAEQAADVLFAPEKFQ